MIHTCFSVCVSVLIASAFTIGSSIAQCQVQNVSQPNYAERPRFSFTCGGAPCTAWDVYVLDYPAGAAGCRLPCHVTTSSSESGNVQMRAALQMTFNGSALTLNTVSGKIRIVAQCVYEQNNGASVSSVYREGLMLRVDNRGVVHVMSTPKPYACGSRPVTRASITPSPDSWTE